MPAPPDAIAGRRVVAARPVAGGDVNLAFRCELEDGTAAFVKTRAGITDEELEAEARGLRWLGEATGSGGVLVPAVLEQGPDWLALPWIEAGGAPDPERLGRGLAELHRAGADAHGASWSYGFGDLRLANDPAPDWASFFADRRLRPLARTARDRGALDPAGADAVERTCARLPELLPEEPPARLHGDLWSGNVLGDREGRPWLIDPAAHGGHREVDLAMLVLFGSPGPRCLAAYDEVLPRADGHAERVELFQLLPLLVHAVLFGGSYGASAARVARRYGG